MIMPWAKSRVTGGCILLAATLLLATGNALAEPTPLADHHIHIQSKVVTDLLGELKKSMPGSFEGLSDDIFQVRTGEAALRELDRAGIQQGVLMSAGYMFGFSGMSMQPEEVASLMRAENRFNVDQALASNGRLVAMVGINPFLDNAMAELNYWSQQPGAAGVKLHLGNSGLHLDNSDQVETLAGFFKAASKARMPLVVHLRGVAPFTATNITTFIGTVLSQAGDLPVQVAHGGSFGGIDAPTLEALKLFGAAIASEAPGTANLVFDLSGVGQLDLSSLEGIPTEGIDAHTTDEWRTLFVNEMRKVGLDRFVLASDWPALTPPTEYFIAERKDLPVTEAEWAELCGNVAPYLRAEWIASRAGTD